jgi:hypothetical protein
VAIAAYVCLLAWVFRGGKVVEVPSVVWWGATPVDRWLTVLRVVPEYVRLMVWPWDLAIDYTPGTMVLVTTVTPMVVLGAVILVLAAGIVALTWRRAPVVAAGILWFAIAMSPVSNVFFASGIVLAERTFYLPSVGGVLVIGWVVAAGGGPWPSRRGGARAGWDVVGRADVDARPVLARQQVGDHWRAPRGARLLRRAHAGGGRPHPGQPLAGGG